VTFVIRLVTVAIAVAMLLSLVAEYLFGVKNLNSLQGVLWPAMLASGCLAAFLNYRKANDARAEAKDNA
jgi:hypothetical protein